MKKSLFFAMFIALIPYISNAQIDYWQGGLFIGATGFSGDVNPQATPDPNDLSYSFGLVGRVDVTPKIGFKGNLSYSIFKGDDLNYDAGRVARAFNFRTRVVELVGIAEWEPFAGDRYYSDAKGDVVMDKLISPYLFLGAGFAFASLNTDFSGYEGMNPNILQGIQADRAEGNTKTAFVVPAGVGVKFDFSNYITVAVDIGWRLVFSDYLDGISMSANPGSDDIYFVSGLTFYYRFFN